DDDDVGARLAEGERGDVARRAVRAVDGDAQALERPSGGGDEVVDVRAVRGARVLLDAADAVTGRPVPRGAETLLDRVLDGVLELVAAVREELDPVVRHGVVGGGDDDAEVDVRRRGEVGDAGGGQHADLDDVDARAREPRGDRGGEEGPGDAGVAADDGPGAAPGGPRARGEHPRRRGSQPERELGGDVAVGEPAHAVGSEQSGHGGPSSRCQGAGGRRTYGARWGHRPDMTTAPPAGAEQGRRRSASISAWSTAGPYGPS